MVKNAKGSTSPLVRPAGSVSNPRLRLGCRVDRSRWQCCASAVLASTHKPAPHRRGVRPAHDNHSALRVERVSLRIGGTDHGMAHNLRHGAKLQQREHFAITKLWTPIATSTRRPGRQRARFGRGRASSAMQDAEFAPMFVMQKIVRSNQQASKRIGSVQKARKHELSVWSLSSRHKKRSKSLVCCCHVMI